MPAVAAKPEAILLQVRPSAQVRGRFESPLIQPHVCKESRLRRSLTSEAGAVISAAEVNRVGDGLNSAIAAIAIVEVPCCCSMLEMEETSPEARLSSVA